MKIQKIRKAKFHAQDGRCYYCDQPMWEDDERLFAASHGITLKQARALRSTAEHLHARCDGGDDSASNIVAACRYCNAARHISPRPLGPDDHAKKIRNRLAAGRWHGLQLAACTASAPGR